MQDTYFINLKGKANIPETLEIGHNYEVKAQGSVTQKKEDDNFDGGNNVSFKFEPVTIEIINHLGKSIKAKDPRKNSQKIRTYLFKLYSDEGYVEAFDDVYDAATQEILMMMPGLLRQAIKRLNK